MIQTTHNIKYLETPSENYSVYRNPYRFALNYAKRNKIPHEVYDEPIDKFVNGKTEPYLRLTFKSNKQHKCFLRLGNLLFPYVEFI